MPLLAHWLTGTLAHWHTGALANWLTGAHAQESEIVLMVKL
jgi:hypothetical protein